VTAHVDHHQRKADKTERRVRGVVAHVIAGLDDGVDPGEIARTVGMGLRSLRHYLTRHQRDDLALALWMRARWGA
jgi:hypothetical protein